jgi:hypothetical protein
MRASPQTRQQVQRQEASRPAQANKLTPRPSPLRHPLLELQRRAGNQAVVRFIQTKLKTGAPQDVYEQEANRVAETVTRTPGPQLQRACACGNRTATGGECAEYAQVMTTSGSSGVAGAPVQVQRLSGPSKGEMTAAPASVDADVIDLDHDGIGDIVIAAPYASPGGVSKAGSVYVLWGKAAWNGTTTYGLSNIQ